VQQRNTIQIFDPATGQYIEREMQPAVSYPAPQPSWQPVPQAPQQARKVEQAPPPVLVYNPQTGQYEPQRQVPVQADIKPAREPKTQKTVKSLGEKMLDNFTRSTASGAGYSVGRTISRGLLGIFGIK